MQQNPNSPVNFDRHSFQQLIAQSPVAIGVLTGEDFVIQSANAALLAIWDKDESVIGLPLAEGLPEIIGQPYLGLLSNVYRTGEAYYGYEAEVNLTREGKLALLYFNFVYQPVRDDVGLITGIMVTATDVSEQVYARKKLEDAEERLRLATEATGLGTFDLDLQSGAIIHSPRLSEIFGLSSKEAVSHQDLRNMIVPADLPIVIKAFDTALQTGLYYYEARVVWPDSTIHWIRTTGKIVYSDASVPLRMLGTLMDITEQKHILNELTKNEETLRLAIQSAELGTFDMDLVNGSMVWDKRCRELFGLGEDVPVTYDNAFLKGLHPDDREKTDQAVKLAFERELTNGDYDVEYRTIAKDNRLRWVRAKGKVYFNEHDVPVRFIGTVLDITENKRNEIRKNDFIAMASHELKTPLTSLKAYIQLLLAASARTGDSFFTNALKKAESQINRMTNLIYGFLDLSKLEAGKLRLQKQDFDLVQVVEEVCAENRPIAQNHHITFELGEPLMLHADPEKISQVVNNLIGNAIKYSPKETEVTVTVTRFYDHVRVDVYDKGIGIKTVDQQYIFQRFYRVEDESTKGFSGFGIGLYLSAEIIELHKGTIGVESVEGKGSRFYFTLPVN
ncbi:PAS domain S-box protein [Mucilaginibacter terrenus]|uniref:histidine kinase n=1 Tax=Mucilaginibacter terrenus TaxID=2482727 RepID=A0A3E2NQP6_9SPHI|nr:PAS domain-containing sensor histidine kinase [Mucilaginibacter terrenus]RFZ83317.1 PAS domain S-box protein [Mucilaginibacter terrenus]